MPSEPKKKAVLDPQDPLPESRWLFRRILMFGFATLFVATIIWTTILIAKLAFNEPSATAEAIKQLTYIVIAQGVINGLLMILYLVAPSGEQVAKMFAMAMAMRDGVSFRGADYAPPEDRNFSLNDDVADADLSADMTQDKNS